MRGYDGHRLGGIADDAAFGDITVCHRVDGWILQSASRRHRRRQGRLAMVDMTDGAHVHMGLGTNKQFPGHGWPPLSTRRRDSNPTAGQMSRAARLCIEQRFHRRLQGDRWESNPTPFRIHSPALFHLSYSHQQCVEKDSNLRRPRGSAGLQPDALAALPSTRNITSHQALV